MICFMHMTSRLFLCLVVSVCIHALALVQPWALMVAENKAEPKNQSIPVKLVDDKELLQEIVPQEEEESEEAPEGLSFETEGKVSADYMALLKARIFEAWIYPDEAIRDGQDGTVKISFVLDRLGQVVEIGIDLSSGSPSLDTAAAAAIKKAGPYGPFTNEIPDTTLKITGSFCYVLD